MPCAFIVTLGNVVAADILNVLLMAGALAAVASEVQEAALMFFHLLFPAMVLVMIVLRSGIFRSGGRKKVRSGFVLLGPYLFGSVAGDVFTQ